MGLEKGWPALIFITGDIWFDEDAVESRFIQASGPGGQHVNKNATAVQLRLPLDQVMGFSGEMRERLTQIAGSKLIAGDVLTASASDSRSQVRNREVAMEKLLSMLQAATVEPKVRKPTKTPRSAKKKRLDDKRKRGEVKKLRSKTGYDS